MQRRFPISFVTNLLGAHLSLLLAACSSSPNGPSETPRLITGKVTTPEGTPVVNARVTLATVTRGEVVFSDNGGVFTLDSIPPGQHTLKVERVGFQLYLAPVPAPVNGVSVMNPMLTRISGNVPAVKPLSAGPVRVRGRTLETDFDRDGVYTAFLVKGAAYSPVPISGSVTRQTHERSMVYLSQMHANTIRTYSGADLGLLDVAVQNNVRVIVGFWVDLNADLSNPAVRQQVKEQFGTMVIELKDSPAVLLWNLGNEQNYGNGNSPYWYTLVQELAIVAYQTEGAGYHPVCASNGAFTNIGDAALNADDASLTYMDLWGSNAYAYDLAAGVNGIRAKTAKPIVLTEWGIDALDNRTRTEYEDVQAQFDSTNWAQILAVGDVCVGGTVFEFLDEWWKAGNNLSHDYGGYPTGAHPDGYSNEEWWGLIAVTPDANGDGLDEWRPRKICYTFSRLWQ
ncbi:MAG: carboxypeptidase regulatory-like domain-containing protein [Bacteroidota bacterium]